MFIVITCGYHYCFFCLLFIVVIVITMIMITIIIATPRMHGLPRYIYLHEWLIFARLQKPPTSVTSLAQPQFLRVFVRDRPFWRVVNMICLG